MKDFKGFVLTYEEQFRNMLRVSEESYLKGNSENNYTDPCTDTTFCYHRVEDKNEIYIGFAGTESLTDIRYDLSCGKQVVGLAHDNSPIRIHDGFYKAFLGVRTIIFNRLKSHANRDTKVFIVGHSLGGTLAVQQALDIIYNRQIISIVPENIFTITLGQPKIGNNAFCSSTNKRMENSTYFRIVNGDDIVPSYPFSWGYSHCGKLVGVGEENWWKVLGSVEDHLHENYLQAIFETYPIAN